MGENKKYKKKVIMFTFNMKRENVSNSEKTKFFKELYGWTQTVPSGRKKYVYHREGVLEEMPHEKINQSSFVIPEDNMNEMMDFFDEWSKKVMMRSFTILNDNSFFKGFNMKKRKLSMEE